MDKRIPFSIATLSTARAARRSAMIVFALAAMAAPLSALADDGGAKGILPIPNYGGDFLSRSYLTGDWGGARTALANKGVQVDLNYDQIVQSVVDGGREYGTRYGGNLDLQVNLDLYRMGLVPGALVKMRAESRYGDSVNTIAGPILPVNTDADFPLSRKPDETVPIVLTDLAYYQFLSEQFGFFVGKFNTLDADLNEFASGRGVSQFFNANFIFNSSIALAAPYSTLGTGIVVKPVEAVTITSSLYLTADSSRSTGFDNFNDGYSWANEADFQYKLFKLPGGVNLGGIYSWNNDFTRLGTRFVFVPGEALSIPKKSDTWTIYLSGWQYLYDKDPSDALINTSDGRPDHEGVGLFWRVGTADDDTCPINWSASGGVGGRGLIPGRADDTYGAGYYYTKIQPGRLLSRLNINDHSQGFEAFYNIAITPAVGFTLDVQVVDDLLPKTDTAVVLGARLDLKF